MIIEKVGICFPRAAASHLRRLEAPNSTRFFVSGLLFSPKDFTLAALLLYQVGHWVLTVKQNRYRGADKSLAQPAGVLISP
jgi:hypothetical protein